MQDWKCKPREWHIDARNRIPVLTVGEYPVYWLKESQKSGILFPNWRWQVQSLTGSTYPLDEYWMVPLSKLISWRITKKNCILVEFGWPGNTIKLSLDHLNAGEYALLLRENAPEKEVKKCQIYIGLSWAVEDF